MIKIGAIAGLVLTSTLLLAACSSNTESKPTNTPSSSSTPTPSTIPTVSPEYPSYAGEQKSPEDFLSAIQSVAPKSKWSLTSSKADANQSGTAGFLQQLDSKDGCSIWLYDSLQHAFDARNQSELANYQNFTGSYRQLGIDIALLNNKIACAKTLNTTVLFINKEVSNHPEAQSWKASKENIHDCLVRGIACIDGVTTVIDGTSDTYKANMKPLYALVDAGLCESFDNGHPWKGGGLMSCPTIDSTDTSNDPYSKLAMNSSGESFVLDVVAASHGAGTDDAYAKYLIYGDGYVVYLSQFEPSKSFLAKMNEAIKGTLIARY